MAGTAKRTVWLIAVGLVLAGMLAAGARAQSSDACRPDIEKFCKGVAPGGGRIAGCLRQHHKELSPGCKQDLEQFKQSTGSVRVINKACGADIQKFCKDLAPGGGHIAECLKQHSDQLSPGCSAALPGSAAPPGK